MSERTEAGESYVSVARIAARARENSNHLKVSNITKTIVEEPIQQAKNDKVSGENFYGGPVRFESLCVYETRARFYVVGSDKAQTYFEVLKIDRSEPREISLTADVTRYSRGETQALLQMIHDGNRGTGGLRLVAQAHGLLGFVRFLHGFYLVLITRRRRVGDIGPHAIFAVDATLHVPLAAGGFEPSSAEERYRQAFQSMAVNDFYFSYTYDLTRTLQANMTSSRSFDKRFVWNTFLTRPIRKIAGPNSGWLLPVVHGFFGQERIAIHGRLIVISLIARRSRHFAGTRYLKRGVNEQGRVANDVETEQIVEDFSRGYIGGRKHFSAFVQLRGSIPLLWGQDASAVTPKPAIIVHTFDPFYCATALHVQDLFARFGAPVVLLNLIKQKEKQPREILLGNEFELAVREINAQLPAECRLQYIAWDFTTAAKNQTEDVFSVLARIARRALDSMGFFHSGRHPCGIVASASRNVAGGFNYKNDSDGRFQCGVLRSNCIDSLDRTNAAQFVVGKAALERQLFALGLADHAQDNLDGSLVQSFMGLYQAMGNQLAWQYGGSQMAHSVGAYSGQQPKSLASRGRDVFSSLRRYYSNSFVDREKQDAINLFLGNYRPWQERTALWELETDYYLHKKAEDAHRLRLTSAARWWEPPLEDYCAPILPSTNQQVKHHFNDFHNVHRLTSFDRELRVDLRIGEPSISTTLTSTITSSTNTKSSTLSSLTSSIGSTNSNSNSTNTANDHSDEQAGHFYGLAVDKWFSLPSSTDTEQSDVILSMARRSADVPLIAAVAPLLLEPNSNESLSVDSQSVECYSRFCDTTIPFINDRHVAIRCEAVITAAACCEDGPLNADNPRLKDKFESLSHWGQTREDFVRSLSVSDSDRRLYERYASTSQ